MNSFAEAVETQETRTENGMKAYKGVNDPSVELFYKAGAMRGQNVIPAFIRAYNFNRDEAIRIALWLRDVRGGAGERQLFRDILQYLERKGDMDALADITVKIPELGRWDDLLCFKTPEVRYLFSYPLIMEGLLINNNGLCAKWMPRKGQIANELRHYMDMTPKQYRKTLVSLTKVVETQMCAGEWDDINFNHVPSQAANNYSKAFKRHTRNYEQYLSDLQKGKWDVKINAAAIYPHQIIYGHFLGNDDRQVEAQWKALPDYMNDDHNLLAMVDVSGSMMAGNPRALDVALGVGLYIADKNQGAFKDLVLTFSEYPELLSLHGCLLDKLEQLESSDWGMNTDIIKAFKKILKVAIDGKVPQKDMPKTLIILSDMQFDRCASFDDSALESVRRLYEKAGYQVPEIVFWNILDHGNMPIKRNEQGVALVSGFSPSILTSLLSGSQIDPRSIMEATINKERYDY